MATTRIASPMRGVTLQLGRFSIRQDTIPKRLSTSFARSITTSTSSQASLSSITTSADDYVPVKPFAEQTVLATIHKFPSLEPLRLERYPANHLYLPTRRDILHRAVVYEGDSTRGGNASTKTRYEVHGSARKIRPQKGTGNARLGDKKSPMLRGGGVSHGPRPRDFATGLPKKVYDLAWRTALSYRFRKGELIIVENAIEIESPSQSLLQHIFHLHKRERGGGRSLLVTLENRPMLEQALEKMDNRRQAVTWKEVDVKDLLELSRIIIERSALQNILREHQEDLTHKTLGYYIKSSPPSDLESTLGWADFRDLMQVPASERDAARPDIYENVCYSRITHAETLPEGAEKMNLKIAAYELLAESFDLRREQLPATGPLEAEIIKAEDDTTVAILETRLRVSELYHQETLLRAQAAEHRRDMYNWKGETELAEAQEEEASDARTDLAGYRIDLLNTKKDLAEARARECDIKGDLAGFEKHTKIAMEMEEELQAANAEAELVGQESVEELDPAVLESIEQKSGDAEQLKKKE